ncbi:MAG: dihydrodipicolinate synthase family protein [Chloroflexi bacterium]|nr:dihydrodipicolinate synthase family protein [Chloroflexota bacterium]
MQKPKGVIPATITAFNSDGSLDIEKTKAYAEWLIQEGVHGLVPNGSTAEPMSITEEERMQVIKATVDQAAGRVPVYAGATHYGTQMQIDLCKAAMDVGAAGHLVLLPLSQAELPVSSAMTHLRKIADGIGQPFILYNNPYAAGYELTNEQVKELVDDGVVNGIKAAHGDPSRVTYLKYLCGDRLSVLYGHDFAGWEALMAGADGWLAAIPGVIPDLIVQLYEAIHDNRDFELGTQIWKRMAPYVYYYNFAESKPHWVAVNKATLRARGLDFGECRSPVEPFTDEEYDVLLRALAPVYPEAVLA